MTRGIKSSLARLGWLLAVPATAVCVSACGGSGHKKTTTTTTHAQTSTTATRPTVPKPRPKVIVETVRAGGSKTFASSVTARPGDPFAIHTAIASSVKSPAKVSLDISGGPSRRLTITATVKGHRSSATVTSATGKRLTVLRLHYACSLPPEPTFCPARNVVSDSKGYQIRFSTTHEAGITLLGTVGPVTLPAVKAVSPGTTIVPPYAVTELLKPVLAHPTATSKTAAPVASLSLRAGDSLEMISRVTSRVRGAAQPVALTIDQGPGKSIRVSASVPGGQASSATIVSATGSPIALVLPRFTCFVAPIPTFCPPSSIQAGSHRYKLTFSAAPGTSPPVVLATVQAG